MIRRDPVKRAFAPSFLLGDVSVRTVSLVLRKVVSQ